ncbi:MAG: hypothetical protein ACI35S_05665 [Anaeroplasma sp.]
MEYLELAQEILELINSHGYEAYIVGGAVRDYLLNIEVNDIDITTSMPVDMISELFDAYNVNNKYLSIKIGYKGSFFEITSFRKDVLYSDHRHPDVVLVKTYEEDSWRRDFTINALAFDYKLNLYDYHNGLLDLKNKIIRTINNPIDRFEEDSLRILRCLYLSSKLNFTIEDETLKAICLKKILLADLSNEKICEYFLKIIKAKYNNGIDYIRKYDLFEFIPEFKMILEVCKKEYNLYEMCLAFYISYSRFPVICLKEYKVTILKISDLIKHNFSLLFLFKCQDEYRLSKGVLSNFGYDIKRFDSMICNFKIKKESDLAINKEWFRNYYYGRDIKNKINEVVLAILEGKIANNEEDILDYLNRSK